MQKGLWVLTHEDGTAVELGDKIKDFRGDMSILIDADPPVHEGSTGRVYVRRADDERRPGTSSAYYPGVFDLKWTRTDQP